MPIGPSAPRSTSIECLLRLISQPEGSPKGFLYLVLELLDLLAKILLRCSLCFARGALRRRRTGANCLGSHLVVVCPSGASGHVLQDAVHGAACSSAPVAVAHSCGRLAADHAGPLQRLAEGIDISFPAALPTGNGLSQLPCHAGELPLLAHGRSWSVARSFVSASCAARSPTLRLLLEHHDELQLDVDSRLTTEVTSRSVPLRLAICLR